MDFFIYTELLAICLNFMSMKKFGKHELPFTFNIFILI